MTSTSLPTLCLALAPALLLAHPPSPPSSPVPAPSPLGAGASPLPPTPPGLRLEPRAAGGLPISPLRGGLGVAAIPELDLAPAEAAEAGRGLLAEGARVLRSGWAFPYRNATPGEVFISVDRGPGDDATVYCAPGHDPDAIAVLAGHEAGRIRVPEGATLVLAVAEGARGVRIRVQDGEGACLAAYPLQSAEPSPGRGIMDQLRRP